MSKIYYVGEITVIIYLYFDFASCRKGDQCFRITHLLMFQKLFNLRLLLMFSTTRLRMSNLCFAKPIVFLGFVLFHVTMDKIDHLLVSAANRIVILTIVAEDNRWAK